MSKLLFGVLLIGLVAVGIPSASQFWNSDLAEIQVLDRADSVVGGEFFTEDILPDIACGTVVKGNCSGFGGCAAKTCDLVCPWADQPGVAGTKYSYGDLVPKSACPPGNRDTCLTGFLWVCYCGAPTTKGLACPGTFTAMTWGHPCY